MYCIKYGITYLHGVCATSHLILFLYGSYLNEVVSIGPVYSADDMMINEVGVVRGILPQHQKYHMT
jgi:hypothetical protein